MNPSALNDDLLSPVLVSAIAAAGARVAEGVLAGDVAGLVTGACPACGGEVCWEPVPLFPGIVPLCDACEERQSADWPARERQRVWQRLYQARMPAGYQQARPERVAAEYRPVLDWRPEVERRHGGAGLIGQPGSGKSSALACAIRGLQHTFLWWSGTEARDAAMEAAMAERDRANAGRRWEAAMRVPLLVLDDISQARFTEAWSSRLFDLLETRLSHRLPVLWTSQIGVADLREKIIRQNGGDKAQAEAISRRLGQHSLVCVG